MNPVRPRRDILGIEDQGRRSRLIGGQKEPYIGMPLFWPHQPRWCSMRGAIQSPRQRNDEAYVLRRHWPVAARTQIGVSTEIQPLWILAELRPEGHDQTIPRRP